MPHNPFAKIPMEEFISNYVSLSFSSMFRSRDGWTYEMLNEQRIFAYPCCCDYEGCQGWQMTSADRFSYDMNLPPNVIHDWVEYYNHTPQ